MADALVFTIRASDELITQNLARKFDQISCHRFEISLKRTGQTIVGPYWFAKYRVPIEESLDFIKAVREEIKTGAVKFAMVEWEGKADKTETITVNLPAGYIKALDEMVSKAGVWQNRDEAIMTAIRNFLWDYSWMITWR
jgi:hypothetical protein